jgi:predicted amidohydrolase
MLERMFCSVTNKSLDLICLPECVSIFTDSKKKINDYLKIWNQNFLKFISEKAKKNNFYILVGSVPYKKRNGKFLNRSFIVNKFGKILCYYDKINLFDVCLGNKENYQESKNYDSGKKIKVTKLPWGKLGMSVCYDVRFPGLYKKLAKRGCDFFSIPAAFTYTTGIDHWHTLIKSRAIENGCFVFAPAQCGVHDNGRRTFGHSLIIDPWGRILSEARKSVTIIYSIVDLELIRLARMKIPSMTNYQL